MLKIIRTLRDADLLQLFGIYEQSVVEKLSERFIEAPTSFAILQEQQDFYMFLQHFLSDNNSLYAVWSEGDRYCSALRLEQCRNGYLLTGFETSADMRRRGYASKLMQAVLEYCRSNAMLPIYSHISNANMASIKIHLNNGFTSISDCAVFLDGSVDHRSKTYIYGNDKKTKS